MALCSNIANVKERIGAELPLERKLVMLGVGKTVLVPVSRGLDMGRNWGQFTFGSGLEADTFGGGSTSGKRCPSLNPVARSTKGVANKEGFGLV